MSEKEKFIGKTRVKEERKEGGFIVKVLEPERLGEPVEPGSEAAQFIIDRYIKETTVSLPKRKPNIDRSDQSYDSTYGGPIF